MGIYPLEAILNSSENKNAYELLYSEFDKLVPYVGTGISFYTSSWGAPFKNVLDDIRGSEFVKSPFSTQLSEAQTRRWANLVDNIPQLSSGANACDTIIHILNHISKVIGITIAANTILVFDSNAINNEVFQVLENLLSAEKYLELGELLNAISFVLTGTTFNQRFHQAIEKYTDTAKAAIEKDYKNALELETIGSSIPLPPSRWFLPYIGGERKFLVTTNCDRSVIYVFRFSSEEVPVLFSGCNRAGEIANDIDHHIIFHIHGVQENPYVDTANSFIMTWSDYQRAYVKRIGSSLQLLQEYYTKKHFLFIGASLEQDMTVEEMKEAAKREHSTNRHVAFMVEKTNWTAAEKDKYNEKRVRLLNDMATETLSMPNYDAYSVVLCQLIREKKQGGWCEFLQLSDGMCLQADGCGALESCRSINSFMLSNNVFDIYEKEFTENELLNELYPALYKYVFDCNSQPKKRSFNWALCRVDTDDFAFPIKESTLTSRCRNKDFFAGRSILHLGTYSAPLGNTIYIIGGNQCLSESTDCLIEKIRIWTSSHQYPDYWTQPVRIRVFRVNCTSGLDRETLEDELERISNIENKAEELEEIIALLNRLQGYKTYSSLFPIDLLKNCSNSECISDELYVLMTIPTILKIIKEAMKGNNRATTKVNSNTIAEDEVEQIVDLYEHKEGKRRVLKKEDECRREW